MQLFLKKTSEFLVLSNIWVGLTAACFSLLGSAFFQNQLSFWTIVFSTQFLYSFQRMFKVKVLRLNMDQDRQIWFCRHEKFMWIWVLLNGMLSLYFLFHQLEIIRSNWISVLICGGISVFYVVPFYKGINLRSLPMAKGFLVALVYTWFTLWLFNSHLEQDQGWLFIIFGSIYVFAATLMFDWRDREIDDRKIRTLPQIFGNKKSLILAGVLYVISLSGFWLLGTIDENVNLVLIALHFLALGYIWKNENALYLSLLFEGLMALVGLAAYCF